jgi:hypothetical protein
LDDGGGLTGHAAAAGCAPPPETVAAKATVSAGASRQAPGASITFSSVNTSLE